MGHTLEVDIFRLTPSSEPKAPDTADFEAQFRLAFPEGFAELFRYIAHLSGDASMASDIAQDAFVKLYLRGAMPDDPRAWLVSVASNALRDEQRRVVRRLRLLVRRTEDLQRADGPSRPDEALLEAERCSAVRSALASLPERDRRLLLLRHEGFTYAELAAALNLTRTSVGTLLARAKAAFRASYLRRSDAPR